MNTFIRLSLLIIVSLFVTSFSNHKGKRYALTCVVIDAGHGGHDSGCLGKRTKEKDVSLAVALKLGKYIESNFKDVKVIYTRKTDVFLELHERVAIANNAKADLFICVHCNSASAHDVSGPETWVMGLHMSEANLEVSKRENEVVLLEKDYQNKYDGFDPNSPEANIIFSLYQNAYMDQSLRMASLVQQEMKAKGRSGRGVKQAGFLVLYKTSMPSILVESGFLTNANEEKYLASAKGQDEIAHSIFNAFKTYKYSVEDNSKSTEDSPKFQEEPPKQPEANFPVVIQEEDNKPPEECCDPPVKSIKPLEDDASHDTLKQNKSASPVLNDPGKQVPASGNSKKDEVVYSVQIVLSSKALQKNDPKFKGEKVMEEKAGNAFKYRTGSFAVLEEAMQYQSVLRNKGFADAFVVAFKNGNRITINQAKVLQQNK